MNDMQNEFNAAEYKAMNMVPERICAHGPDQTLWEMFDGKQTLWECLRKSDRIMDTATLKKLIAELHASEASGNLRLHYKSVTTEQFREALQKLGVSKGMNLVVHSTFSSLGRPKESPEKFCCVLEELVGMKGTLLMPTFAFKIYHTGDPAAVFDVRNTPSNTGILTETFRHLPGVYRSCDPCHAFAAWGKNALQLVKDHHKVPTVSALSPLGLLEKMDGWCLTISAWKSVTFMHVVENSCGVPCLGVRTEEYKGLLPDGRDVRLRTWGWRKSTCPDCPANHSEELFASMRRNGTLRESMIGTAHLCLFRLADYRTVYSEMLNRCNCWTKSPRPRVVAAAVESDWDSQNSKLKPSAAFAGDIY